MNKLVLSTALSCAAFAAQADVTVMSWGGAYGTAQNEAHLKPFTEKTGIRTVMVDSDNPASPIKAMVEARNVTIDVVSLELADAIRLCDEGVLEPIDASTLPDGADGTPATVAQMAQDVSQFLGWAAEPKLEDRKGMGVKVILFLVILTGLTVPTGATALQVRLRYHPEIDMAADSFAKLAASGPMRG